MDIEKPVHFRERSFLVLSGLNGSKNLKSISCHNWIFVFCVIRTATNGQSIQTAVLGQGVTNLCKRVSAKVSGLYDKKVAISFFVKGVGA